MNKTTEALKLAEEALYAELESDTYEEFAEAAEKCHKALAAIREALAESVKQEPVACVSIEALASERYKVVPSDSSMFYRHAVVAGDGKQQLYIGREVECENMARKFAGAFLDGAFCIRNAAPVRTKDLTEYELDELRFQNLNYLDYARAVIAADREKNK